MQTMNMSVITIPGELSMTCVDPEVLNSGESRLRHEDSETYVTRPVSQLSLKELMN